MKNIVMAIFLMFQSLFSIGACASLPDQGYGAESHITDTVNIGGYTYYVEWLLKDDFESGKWTDHWVLETSDGEVEVKNGKLWITDRGIGSTLWHKGEFPKQIIVRYTARSEEGMQDNKLNFNHISHAREHDGETLTIGEASGRTGAYSQYHQFANYIATLTFKHSRLRKDPGFNLLSDSEMYAAEGQSYDVVYVVNKGRIQYYLNHVKVHDIQDSEPLEGGKFGLRTWNTRGSWDNIEIGLVKGIRTQSDLK